MRPLSRPVPAFPLVEDPGDWDSLTLLAATLLLEAEGEPPEGQLAVGCVVMTRHDAWHLSIAQVILGPEGRAWGEGKAFEPFSCWNDAYRAKAEARLAAAEAHVAEPAWRAAATALWQLAPDPTQAADFYLNVPLTRKLREGTLPDWYDEAKVTARLGRHTFLRVG